MIFKILPIFVFTMIASIYVMAQTACPPNQHWDPVMNMCMPDGGAVTCPANMHWSIEEDQCIADNCKPNEKFDIISQKCISKNSTPICPANQHWDTTMSPAMCMPNVIGSTKCPSGEVWDNNMNMCMPLGKTTLSLHGSQYLIGLSGSGPRGRTDFSAPNMFMLTFQERISKCDSVKVIWMGTTDKWTTPKDGTPELLQTGEAKKDGTPYLDAQHPHTSPVMGLTVAEVHCFGKEGQNTFTISFAPRGEATAGPQAFMHRQSAEGNPNAPLGHHLQDVFHIMSSVIAAKVEFGKWSIEGSVFSGQEPSPSEVDLKMGPINSAGIRTEYQANKNFKFGASAASVYETPRPAPGEMQQPSVRNTLLAAWVTTNHDFKTGSLKTTSVYAQGTEDKQTLRSFLQEVSYKFSDLQKDHVFSRFEVLQRTPEQLEINVIGDSKNPEWIKALTVGYERSIKTKKSVNVFAGGSVTKSFVPANFQTSYGQNLLAGEIHLRIVFNKNWKLRK